MKRMAQRTKQLVVIGTSAGGLEALRVIAGALPPDFDAPICIVMHVAPQASGLLHEILNRSGPLTAVSARNGERLQSGRIYVAPPDAHLVIEPGRVRVTKGPRDNRFRPAIDPLFRSAAQVYGPAAIAVVLTGNLDDGAARVWAIKRLGGVTIVQDPADAMFPSMPQHALSRVTADHVAPLAAIAPLIVRLTTAAPQEIGEIIVPEHLDVETNIAKEQSPIDAGLERIATPSRFACPECHGVLLQLHDDTHIRFRCHTGHAYSIDSLLAAISAGVDDALWNATRALEEAGLLINQIGEHLTVHDGGTPQAIAARLQQARDHAAVLRRMTRERQPLTTTTTEE
jgi:two-component system chemotaxis response regulator CheB